jgi:adenosylhomocysteine nucleosidase
MSAQAHSDFGVVVALPIEAGSFGLEHRRVGECGVFDWGTLAIAGLGYQRAAAAAHRLIERGARALLSWGVAGGLSPALSPGDLLLPLRVIAEEGEWNTGAELRARLRHVLAAGALEGGDLYCSSTPVTSVESKRALAARGMLAVDMESAAVATVAQRAGVPFVAVKAICDPATREIPAAALRLLGHDGSLRWRAMPSLLGEGPRTWRDLNALREDLAAARGSLWRAARVLPRCAQP